MDMSMGQRIRKFRKNKGYTQEYVACAIGISRQAVFKWEKDQTCPDTANLIALAELLGTTVDDLTGGTTAKKRETGAGYLKASLVPLLLIPVCWLIGLLSGAYTDMVQIPVTKGIRIGIPFLLYGHSPAAIVLVCVSVVCLILLFVLWIMSYFSYKDNN